MRSPMYAFIGYNGDGTTTPFAFVYTRDVTAASFRWAARAFKEVYESYYPEDALSASFLEDRRRRMLAGQEPLVHPSPLLRTKMILTDGGGDFTASLTSNPAEGEEPPGLLHPCQGIWPAARAKRCVFHLYQRDTVPMIQGTAISGAAQGFAIGLLGRLYTALSKSITTVETARNTTEESLRDLVHGLVQDYGQDEGVVQALLRRLEPHFSPKEKGGIAEDWMLCFWAGTWHSQFTGTTTSSGAAEGTFSVLRREYNVNVSTSIFKAITVLERFASKRAKSLARGLLASHTRTIHDWPEIDSGSPFYFYLMRHRKDSTAAGLRACQKLMRIYQDHKEMFVVEVPQGDEAEQYDIAGPAPALRVTITGPKTTTYRFVTPPAEPGQFAKCSCMRAERTGYPCMCLFSCLCEGEVALEDLPGIGGVFSMSKAMGTVTADELFDEQQRTVEPVRAPYYPLASFNVNRLRTLGPAGMEGVPPAADDFDDDGNVGRGEGGEGADEEDGTRVYLTFKDMEKRLHARTLGRARNEMRLKVAEIIEQAPSEALEALETDNYFMKHYEDLHKKWEDAHKEFEEGLEKRTGEIQKRVKDAEQASQAKEAGSAPGHESQGSTSREGGADTGEQGGGNSETGGEDGFTPGGGDGGSGGEDGAGPTQDSTRSSPSGTGGGPTRGRESPLRTAEEREVIEEAEQSLGKYPLLGQGSRANGLLNAAATRRGRLYQKVAPDRVRQRHSNPRMIVGSFKRTNPNGLANKGRAASLGWGQSHGTDGRPKKRAKRGDHVVITLQSKADLWDKLCSYCHSYQHISQMCQQLRADMDQETLHSNYQPDRPRAREPVAEKLNRLASARKRITKAIQKMEEKEGALSTGKQKGYPTICDYCFEDHLTQRCTLRPQHLDKGWVTMHKAERMQGEHKKIRKWVLATARDARREAERAGEDED